MVGAFSAQLPLFAERAEGGSQSRGQLRNTALQDLHGAEETLTPKRPALTDNSRYEWLRQTCVSKIAIIEDDAPTSNQLAGWIRTARPGIEIHQWTNRDDAEAALGRETYDMVVLDIELGRERNAGVALINAINKGAKGTRGTPVLVVSAMPAAIYRSIMKALDAWDYLQKTTFEESDFIETFLDILRAAKARQSDAKAEPASANETELMLDPLWQRNPTWRGKRINLPLTAQRILATLHQQSGQVVSYEDLFDVVKSGRNRDNIRKHVSTIRDAFREIDPDFDGIENVPMRGFRWVSPRG